MPHVQPVNRNHLLRALEQQIQSQVILIEQLEIHILGCPIHTTLAPTKVRALADLQVLRALASFYK